MKLIYLALIFLRRFNWVFHILLAFYFGALWFKISLITWFSLFTLALSLMRTLSWSFNSTHSSEWQLNTTIGVNLEWSTLFLILGPKHFSLIIIVELLQYLGMHRDWELISSSASRSLRFIILHKSNYLDNYLK